MLYNKASKLILNSRGYVLFVNTVGHNRTPYSLCLISNTRHKANALADAKSCYCTLERSLNNKPCLPVQNTVALGDSAEPTTLKATLALCFTSSP